MRIPSFPVLSVLFLALVSSSCSPALSPGMIAAHPKDTPIARYPPASQFIYHADIELTVADVDRVSSQAARLVLDYGGRQTDSYSWYTGGKKHTVKEFIVPTPNFHRLRAELIGLGDLQIETLIGGPPATLPYEDPAVFSSITLRLSSAGFALPPVQVGGWDPLRTFRSAFSVFLSIFGFLVDILIWVLVVGGPFILISLGIRWLFIRLQRTREIMGNHSLKNQGD